MAPRAVLSRDEYHLKIRQNVDALKARLKVPSFFTSEEPRDKVLCYFMERAVQLGEACFRIADLPLPLVVLARVLCEDIFTLCWALVSETNLAEYHKGVISEMVKMMRLNLQKGRARVRNVSTGKDVTAEFLPELNAHVTTKKNIEQMAQESGLSKLYDIIYRYDSLEVHANTFGLSDFKPEMDPISVAASAINAFLRVILLIADNKNRFATADEVLTTLNMRSFTGT